MPVRILEQTYALDSGDKDYRLAINNCCLLPVVMLSVSPANTDNIRRTIPIYRLFMIQQIGIATESPWHLALFWEH